MTRALPIAFSLPQYDDEGRRPHAPYDRYPVVARRPDPDATRPRDSRRYYEGQEQNAEGLCTVALASLLERAHNELLVEFLASAHDDGGVNGGADGADGLGGLGGAAMPLCPYGRGEWLMCLDYWRTRAGVARQKWRLASVLATDGAAALIHFDGFASRWDAWIDTAPDEEGFRLRPLEDGDPRDPTGGYARRQREQQLQQRTTNNNHNNHNNDAAAAAAAADVLPDVPPTTHLTSPALLRSQLIVYERATLMRLVHSFARQVVAALACVCVCVRVRAGVCVCVCMCEVS